MTNPSIVGQFGAVKADRQMQARRRLKLVNATPEQNTSGRQKHMASRGSERIHRAWSSLDVQRLASANPNDRRASLWVFVWSEDRNYRAIAIEPQGAYGKREAEVRGKP
jgi:hypothetical protein